MQQTRNELVNKLYQELVGPKEIDEIVESYPSVYYSSGILYPSECQEEVLENVYTGEISDDEEEIQPIPSLMNKPASIGLAFLTSPEASLINCNITYGRYFLIEQNKWQRKHFSLDTEVQLINGTGRYELENEFHIEWVVKRREEFKSVHLFLVNRKKVNGDPPIEDLVFQPKITLTSPGEEDIFLDMEIYKPTPSQDEDIESFRLLYRNKGEFATGHNCAAEWADTKNHATWQINSTFLPGHEIPMMSHLNIDGMEGLSMEVLSADCSGVRYKELLSPLTNAYKSWIDGKERESLELEERYRLTADRHIRACKEVLDRIYKGIDLIASQEDIREAFKFCNKVMLDQRSYSAWASEYRQTGIRNGDKPTLKGIWRPFQIAFILLNIAGIALPTDPEREIADLLWFPTGGGKTEAYLGVAAFTLGLRRLRGQASNPETYAGTSVIMRYTLRLLTIQQFQRAAAMICACEVIRRKDPRKWGLLPFEIGLWVGSKTTPNNLEDAQQALDKLREGKQVYEGNPVQLHNCPWCGEELDHADYIIGPDETGLIIRCSRDLCEFNDKIPAITVDQDIYRKCPSILIGTVDKFARLPLNNKIGSIFGLVEQYCERHGFVFKHENHPRFHRTKENLPSSETRIIGRLMPPDLIIQDELHLISGPLGTMVGLYESAIDTMSTVYKDNVEIRPKVIASTATIRRAKQQIKQLFARESCQFPPSGLDASDSFFSVEESLENKPGRLYVGVFLPGNSTQTNEVRVYSTLLQAAYERKDYGTIDPYWTVVGYYNSLRELGGALRLFEDDIPDRLKYLNSSEDKPRYLNRVEELTSRKSSDEIPKVLSMLEKNKGSGKALDAILATNIISVGVDVERIGLMVVNGQPKGTSEYIQSSSRVGRKHPGLVVTIYNWMRPRDISHYERFVSYHSMLYRYVEATSITPFSPRARDKGLTAIFIGMVRQLDKDLTENVSAARFSGDRKVIKGIIRGIRRRVLLTDPEEWPEVERELYEIINWWENRTVKHGEDLKYHRIQFDRKDELVHTLLNTINEFKSDPESRGVSDSMRDVEKEITVFYKK